MSRGVSPMTTVRSRGPRLAVVPGRRAAAGDRRQVAAVLVSRSRSRPARPRSSVPMPARASFSRATARGCPSRARAAVRRRAASASSSSRCAGREPLATGRRARAPRSVAPPPRGSRRAASSIACASTRRAAGSRARSPCRCGRRPRPAAARRADAPDLVDRFVHGQRVLARRLGAACRRCRTAASSSAAGHRQRSKLMSGGRRCANAAISARRVLDVVELDHLDRRVHVAQRDRDEPGRDAVARGEDRVGVGAGRARGGRERVRDLLGLGGLDQQLDDRRVERRAALDDRARAEVVRAELRLVDPRRVGRVRDVDGDREPGRSAVRGRARAAEAGLLLRPPRRRSHRRARRPPRPPAAPPRGDEAAEPVVHRARDDAAVAAARSVAVDHRDVADRARARAPRRRPWRRCRCAAPRISGTFLRSSGLSRWIGFLPSTPGIGAASRREHDALADQDLRVPAADADEAQEARSPRCA